MDWLNIKNVRVLEDRHHCWASSFNMSPMSSWNAGECVSPTSDGDLLTKLKFHCKRDTNDVSRGTAVRAREGTYCDRYVAQKHFDREIENLSRGTVMGWKRRKPLSSVVVPVPVPDPESCVSGGALCVVLFVLCAVLCACCAFSSPKENVAGVYLIVGLPRAR